jgi:hypothetical protein
MIVVTTTLQDLEAAAGKALTAGGSALPVSDLLRMASHAHHYLAIFDHGKALALHHTKRLASPAQRIMLYAKTSASYALLANRQVSRFESCQSTPLNSADAEIWGWRARAVRARELVDQISDVLGHLHRLVRVLDDNELDELAYGR